ncbi:MAG: sigma-70 family RNA polymerase sigma factor [Acidobacteriia bacterium]|nr:sigma-70 family RNA polymerase sigma factor [Terriglobia bacterium]
MEFSDQDLTREIRSGSKVAFEKLVSRYGRLVHRIAFGFTGDRESAMDVAQDTFLKVHTRLGTFREDGDLRNWIARIAAHEALNLRRAARRHPTSELDETLFLDPDPPQDERLHERETREALHRSLATLSPRQRLAVVLRYFQGMSPREIGAVLECSEGTARSILFRSLRRLRAVLVESEGSLP